MNSIYVSNIHTVNFNKVSKICLFATCFDDIGRKIVNDGGDSLTRSVSTPQHPPTRDVTRFASEVGEWWQGVEVRSKL